MATRADRLTSEIETTRQDLAGHLSELKSEASATARRALVLAAVGMALIVGLKIVRSVLRRRE